MPPDVGINALVHKHAGRVARFEIDDPDAFDDLDTPEDYHRWSMTVEPKRRVQVRVRLFALARQRAGQPELTLDLPERATVADLKRSMAEVCPALGPLMSHLLIAINAEYARDDDEPIPAGADVAAIPPVSGGTIASRSPISRTLP